MADWPAFEALLGTLYALDIDIHSMKKQILSVLKDTIKDEKSTVYCNAGSLRI